MPDCTFIEVDENWSGISTKTINVLFSTETTQHTAQVTIGLDFDHKPYITICRSNKEVKVSIAKNEEPFSR